MKRFNGRKASALYIAAIALSVLAGCTSTGPKQKTEVLDDKGAAFGIQTPEWVAAYIMGGNLDIQKLSIYKGLYCFVIEYADASKDFATAWVANASGPQAIAQKVSTTVSSSMSASLEGERGADTEANLRSAAESLSNASFNGATKTGDWWQTVRNTTTEVIETRAWALWTINQKQLDEQVAANIQNIIDNNTTMSAAERAIYTDLIKQIRDVGGILNN
ncbi:hypothetical protein AGMMS49579_02290 [Spirochaetia bacterium]|nr:hypothetical protein AGMMS49579_01980 [Spirochaetia bacterium]GHV49770.1 hypothetical protein AGMMS49579_02290 [Spirochaetia bacterium]